MNENKYVSEDEIKAYLKSVMEQANMLDGITDDYFVNEMVDQMYAQLQYRLGAVIISKVNDEDQSKVEEAFNSDQGLESISSALREIIPNIDMIIVETIKKFSEEYINNIKNL